MTGKPKAVRPVAEAINSAGFHNHLSKFSSSKEDLEAMRLKREREEADRAKLDEGEGAFTARCYRRLARIQKWAERQSREELVEHLALTFLLLIEKKKSVRHAARMRSQLEGGVEASTLHARVYEYLAKDFLRDIAKIREERRQRGVKAAERSPKTKAMAAIKVEFNRWKDGGAEYKNNSVFARDMMLIHGAVLDNEGSIKNKCVEWRRERKNHPAS